MNAGKRRIEVWEELLWFTGTEQLDLAYLLDSTLQIFFQSSHDRIEFHGRCSDHQTADKAIINSGFAGRSEHADKFGIISGTGERDRFIARIRTLREPRTNDSCTGESGSTRSTTVNQANFCSQSCQMKCRACADNSSTHNGNSHEAQFTVAHGALSPK